MLVLCVGMCIFGIAQNFGRKNTGELDTLHRKLFKIESIIGENFGELIVNHQGFVLYMEAPLTSNLLCVGLALKY